MVHPDDPRNPTADPRHRRGADDPQEEEGQGREDDRQEASPGRARAGAERGMMNAARCRMDVEARDFARYYFFCERRENSLFPFRVHAARSSR